MRTLTKSLESLFYKCSFAALTQLVECGPSKSDAAGSYPARRSEMREFTYQSDSKDKVKPLFSHLFLVGITIGSELHC